MRSYSAPPSTSPLQLVRQARDLLLRACRMEAPMVRQELILKADRRLEVAEAGLRKSTA